MPVKAGKRGKWQELEATTDWKTMATALASDECEVATDLYYVNVAKTTEPSAAPARTALASVIDATRFRNIGPFRTSAWVTEIAVPDAPARDHLYTMYAATRTGGL